MARTPASRYVSSGSSFPRYRKPSAVVLNKLHVDRVTRPQRGTWLVLFKDGMAVNVHKSEKSERFHAGRVHDHVNYYVEARPEPASELAHAYQYAALTRVVPHQAAFHLMPRSSGRGEDLFADVHDELYPDGRDASRSRDMNRKRTIGTTRKERSRRNKATHRATTARKKATSSRDQRHKHRSRYAPPFRKQQSISRKIRLLREEGYSAKQAAAIAYRMNGARRVVKRHRRA